MEQKQDKQIEESILQLSDLLQLDAEVLRSMVGKRVKGSAEFGKDGSFRFDPQKERGASQSEVKKTQKGSKLVRTIGENRLKLHCCAPAGEKDPEAWIADEVNRLLKGTPVREVKVSGRMIERTDSIHIAVNQQRGTLEVGVFIPIAQGRDWFNDITAEFSQVMKRLMLNRQQIDQQAKLYMKNNPKQQEDND